MPVVPGDNGPTVAAASRRRKRRSSRRAKIGLPVMLKASAGGGGKGMRLVDDEKKFVAAYQGAQREAKSAFGDDAVYLEKAVIRPRHVEIQVFADAHGNIVHLFERDCSIQRRHQKVIEEAPSPAVTPELRAKMGEVAVKAAAAVNYVGAGTCEFLLSEDGNFYFLEMNTRLQVEHPVTEMITQRDLVRLQIAVADGEKLPFTQEDLKVHGAAIECRIYAEDPIKFLPSPGKIVQYRQPTGPYVRDDSGIYEGSEISVFYDPMISKLITWGATRAEAIERMERALMEYRVGGIKTNLAFHRRVLARAGLPRRQVLDGVHRGAQGAPDAAHRARRERRRARRGAGGRRAARARGRAAADRRQRRRRGDGRRPNARLAAPHRASERELEREQLPPLSDSATRLMTALRSSRKRPDTTPGAADRRAGRASRAAPRTRAVRRPW